MKPPIALPSTELTNRLISDGIATNNFDLSKYSYDYKCINFSIEKDLVLSKDGKIAAKHPSVRRIGS